MVLRFCKRLVRVGAELWTDFLFTGPEGFSVTVYIIPAFSHIILIYMPTVFRCSTVRLSWTPIPEMKKNRYAFNRRTQTRKHKAVISFEFEIWNEICKPLRHWSPINPFPGPLSLQISQTKPHCLVKLV